jgi:hypothetical protein
MWVLGIIVLLALVAAGVAALNRVREEPSGEQRWDIGSLGVSYSAIISPLAAFSVASAVFLANLTRASASDSFEQVMALFLIAFIMLMGTSLMFATTRSLQPAGPPDRSFVLTQRVLYELASLGFYAGLNTSWLGLRPLLESIELHELADVFSWLLLFSLISGSMRQGAWLHSLLGIRAVPSYAVTLIPFAAATVYRLVIATAFAGLWPSNPTTAFALVVFGVTSLAFVVETNMIRFHGKAPAEAMVSRAGPVVVPPYVASVVASLALLWFSLVMSAP